MAVLPRARQGRRSAGGGGGTRVAASTPAPARKSTQSGIRQQRVGGAGSSPRLHLTHKRTPTIARRDTTDGASGKNSRSSSGGGSGSACARAGSRPAVSAAAAAGTRGRKRATQADTAEVANMMSVLKSDLSAALERTMDTVEKECGEFVKTALSGCTASASRREEDQKTAEAALLEMDTRQAGITAQCEGMLQTVESSSIGLSAMVDRCNGALDKMQQAESRKLKSALDRATAVVT